MATRYTMMGTVAGVTAAVVAALVAMSGGERAQSLGLTQHGALITAQDAGAADAVAAVAVAPGTAGQVLTVSDAGLPHWAAAASGGPTVTTYHASDFAAEQGGVSGGAAAISGVDDASTATLTIAATSSTYGTSGSNSPRIVLPLPVGAQRIEVVVQCTATSGTGDNWRYLGFGLRNTANGGTPAALWGVGTQTLSTPGLFVGGIMGGANTGHGASAFTNTGIFAADRWMRLTWRPNDPYFWMLNGAGSAGARPTLWYPPNSSIMPVNGSGALAIGDDGSALALAVFFQSFGGSGTLTFTFKITVRVWT